MKKQNNLVMNYDRKADVLYISFGAPQKADDTQLISDDVIVRKKGKKVVGITLLHFKKSYVSS